MFVKIKLFLMHILHGFPIPPIENLGVLVPSYLTVAMNIFSGTPKLPKIFLTPQNKHS